LSKNLNENQNENDNENDNENCMTRYVNRLSDYLFILARKLNIDNGVKDVTL
jgi:cob(I)alamin adenosyltransferase